METSAAERERRRELVPIIQYPEELPVSVRRAAIQEALAAHQVVVVCGETGSGKTTQLPKMCLDLGRGVGGMIGHTQPRRIAARSVANRISDELGDETGGLVGYRVRFGDRVGPNTLVKLVTDGMLLAETSADPWLEQYDTLIIDEAHERSLNIDFLLGYLKNLLPRRRDLKLIITSATIDPESFSRHFHRAPVVEVSGRTYPVEIIYRDPAEADRKDGQGEQIDSILAAVDELAARGPGDILVFLAGEREIRETAEALRKHHPPQTEILPLYARLATADQNRIFQAHQGRRIVLATNVAETSLTVPGIRFVVDPGGARISRYSVRSKVQRLPIEPISQASANQRAGRCGRVQAGVCIRLFGEEDFQARDRYTDPEIRRTSLAAVILQMAHLGLGDIAGFPFLDPPDPKQITDGYRLLEELGAMDASRRITRIGRELAQIPLDPRLGRIVLAGRDFGCLTEAAVVATALSIQDPRERPLDAREAADECHARFADPRSDFVALINLWRHYHEQAQHLSKSRLRKRCRDEFLSWNRMREWQDIHRQVLAQLKGVGARVNSEPADYEPLHRALLSGLLGHVGQRQESAAYLGTRNRQFHVFPGSGLMRRQPRWLMAAELVETTRLYGRTVARVEPSWIEAAAGALLKRSYSNPRWEKRRGRVVATETVTLYGLVLVAGRTVAYGPVDPEQSRQIFIREALVHGHYDTRAEFFRANRDLIDEVELLEAKSRRRDVLVDEDTLHRFYEERVPAAIHDAKRFERWRARVERADPRALFFERDDLMRQSAEHVDTERFPDSMVVAGVTLPLAYRFEPGHDADGVSVTVPAAILGQLPEERFRWLVPGMLLEKVTGMLRSLPKSLRRQCVPIPDFARACVEAMPFAEGTLSVALSAQLQRMAGVVVSPDAWAEGALPLHLRMNFRIVDAGARPLGQGRDLALLRDRHGKDGQTEIVAHGDARFQREGITRWDFGELPESSTATLGGVAVKVFPALVDRRTSVAMTLCDSEARARDLSRDGMRRLFMLAAGRRFKSLRRSLPGLSEMCLRFAAVGSCQTLTEDIVATVAERCFIGDLPLPRDPDTFGNRLEEGLKNLDAHTEALCRVLGEALELYHRAGKVVDAAAIPATLHALLDVRSQLSHLVYPGFVLATPEARLGNYPAYLKGVIVRVEKLVRDPSRDRRLGQQITPLWDACRKAMEQPPASFEKRAELARYRWMLEEYRLSIFAQEVGASERVSEQRLAHQWRQIS